MWPNWKFLLSHFAVVYVAIATVFFSCYIGDLVLWNPSTQQQRILPKFPGRGNLDYPTRVRIGLGYGSSRDDHKVVVIQPIRYNDPSGVVEYWAWIFGFRSFSWRRVNTSFRARPNARSLTTYYGYFAHGNLHWLFGYGTISYDLVAFDMAKETFSTLAKPDYNLAKEEIARLNILDGWLCMSCCFNIVKLETRLYLRKKDGAEFAWSLLYSVTVEQLPPFLTIYNFFQVGILGYSSRGDKIMLDLGVECVVSYDIKKKCFLLMDIKVPAESFYSRTIRFVESLVPVARTEQAVC